MKLDKKKHLAAGIVLGLLGALLHPALGIGAAFLAGVLKELYDMTGKGTPETADLLYTVAGGVIGTFITMGVMNI